jgi:hypothetical protein
MHRSGLIDEMSRIVSDVDLDNPSIEAIHPVNLRSMSLVAPVKVCQSAAVATVGLPCPEDIARQIFFVELGFILAASVRHKPV